MPRLEAPLGWPSGHVDPLGRRRRKLRKLWTGRRDKPTEYSSSADAARAGKRFLCGECRHVTDTLGRKDVCPSCGSGFHIHRLDENGLVAPSGRPGSPGPGPRLWTRRGSDERKVWLDSAQAAAKAGFEGLCITCGWLCQTFPLHNFCRVCEHSDTLRRIRPDGLVHLPAAASGSAK